MESFVVGKDLLTLEEVKTTPHTRKLRQKRRLVLTGIIIMGYLLNPKRIEEKEDI